MNFQMFKLDLEKAEESESEVAQSCLTLCDPMDSSLHQTPPSMGFSRQEYWSGLPFPSLERRSRKCHLSKVTEVVSDGGGICFRKFYF